MARTQKRPIIIDSLIDAQMIYIITTVGIIEFDIKLHVVSHCKYPLHRFPLDTIEFKIH